MKRSAELTPLSHQHHRALYAAMRLKRAETQVEGQALLDFHRSEGERHFELEEQILLPCWIAGDRGADLSAAERILSEHLELRVAVERVEMGGVPVEELHRVGELLEAHVRFEERELFPAIEAALSGEELTLIGERIAAAGRSSRTSGGEDLDSC